MKKVFSNFLPLLFWMGVIFLGSSIPGASVSENFFVDFLVHKVVHLFEYGILFILSYRSFGKNSWWAFIFTIFYGFIDEAHQAFVPRREARGVDVLVDGVGALLGLVALEKFNLKKSSMFSVPSVPSVIEELLEITTKSTKQTKKVAQAFAKNLKGGDILALFGDLGSGKTTFVQGLALGLGIKKRVLSPSFVFIRQYKLPNRQTAKLPNCLYHIDLYRITDPSEAEGLGLEEICSDPKNIVVIEWADRIRENLPQRRIDVFFKYVGENRREIRIANISED